MPLLGCFNSLQLGCQREMCALFSSRITSVLETHDMLHLTKCSFRGSNLLFRNYVQAKDDSLEVLQHIILYLSTRRPWTIGSPGHVTFSFFPSKNRLNILKRIILLEAGHAGCCVQHWRLRRPLENRSGGKCQRWWLSAQANWELLVSNSTKWFPQNLRRRCASVGARTARGYATLRVWAQNGSCCQWMMTLSSNHDVSECTFYFGA